MIKVIARIAAFIVCIVAAWHIYGSVQRAYFHEAVHDFIAQGENFAQNKPVEPSEVEDNTPTGKFINLIAVYWRTFQDLNNEMDTETNKMRGAFDAKAFSSEETLKSNLERMDAYRALVMKDSDAIEKNAENFITEVSKLDQKEVTLVNIGQVKQEFAEDKKFRQAIADVRKTIASYMYSSLEFLYSRQGSISFAENGAITFKNPADQKYFYDLMEVIRQSESLLKDQMAQNRIEISNNVAEIKKAYQQAKK
jgi:hypothetical protein